MHMKMDVAHIYYLKVPLRGPLLNSKYVLHNACVDVPFPFKEGGGNGGLLHNAHENGCSTYLLFKSAPLMYSKYLELLIVPS